MATSIKTLPNVPTPAPNTPPTSTSTGPAAYSTYQPQIPIYSLPSAPQQQSTSSAFKILSWAERKTRHGAERQVERRIVKAEAEGTTVLRATEDPREPEYLARRREMRLGGGEALEQEFVSGALREKV